MPDPVSEAARILGERLRDERLRIAASQEDVAHLADMNVSNYGKIERGLGNPKVHTLVTIAGVLGVDPGKLLSGIDGDMVPGRPRVYRAVDFIREREARARS